MKFFAPNRLIFVQAPGTPEQQTQPPTEKGTEMPNFSMESGKDQLPSSAEAVSNTTKEAGKKVTNSALNQLPILENLKVS